jgi:hypothetical protein
MPGLQVHFEVLNQLNSPALYAATLANRPAAQLVGRIFFRTDSPFGLYRDTGSAWDLIANVDTNAVTGSGATGQVTYFSSANVIAGNNNLFWDSTNNRLGINTATPGVALDIHGTGTITQFNGTGTSNSFVNFQNAGTGKWRVGNNYSGATNYFSIFDQTNSVETLKITPGATNAILFTGNLTATTLIKSGGTSAEILAADGSVITAGTNITISGGTIAASGGGGMSIGGSITGATAGSVLFAGTSGVLAQKNANFFWDNTNNRLGINTTSPSFDLETLGDIAIRQTTNVTSRLVIVNQTASAANAATEIQMTTNSGQLIVGKKSPTFVTSGMLSASDSFFRNPNTGDIVITNEFSTGKIRFGAGGATTAQATLTAAGRLLIGTTTESTYILDIVGSSRVSSDMLINNITVGTGNNTTALTAETTAVGYQSGKAYDNGASKRNSSFGFRSALNVTTGYQNTLLGAYSGSQITTGFDNVIIGVQAMNNSNTSQNVAIGNNSLSQNTGNNNVVIGYNSGYYRNTGNTDIGYNSAANAAATGSYNISLGFRAGQYSGDYKLYIASVPATYGNLIYGDFTTGQIKINDSNTPSLTASAQLEIVSTTRGFLPPRMTTTQKNAISSPAQGLMVFDTTLVKLCVYSGTAWETITSV